MTLIAYLILARAKQLDTATPTGSQSDAATIRENPASVRRTPIPGLNSDYPPGKSLVKNIFTQLCHEASLVERDL